MIDSDMMKHQQAEQEQSDRPISPGSSAKPRGDRPDSPVYLRIANTLADRITSGLYAAGTRLPSGSEICREFGVSPMTMRHALDVLHDQGLVYGEKGKGTFARSLDLGDSLFRLDSPTGEWLDESAEIRLLSASMERADYKVANMLGLSPGDRVIYLRRLVLYDGLPVMYHIEHITYDPRRPFVESQLQLTSLHAFLDPSRAQRFPRAELTMEAVSLDKEGATALGQPEGALALRLEHVFQESDRKPVSWGWFLLRAELFRLRARLGPE